MEIVAKNTVNFINLVAKFSSSTLYAHSINKRGHTKSNNAARPIPPETNRENNMDAIKQINALFVKCDNFTYRNKTHPHVSKSIKYFTFKEYVL